MSFHLKSTFPDFAAELETKLIAKGHHTYAAQVAELIVTDRCNCGEERCASMVCGFYLEDVPLEEEDQEELLLAEIMSLEVIAFKGKIVYIDLLYREEIHAILNELIPVRPRQRGRAAEPEGPDDRSDAESS